MIKSINYWFGAEPDDLRPLQRPFYRRAKIDSKTHLYTWHMQSIILRKEEKGDVSVDFVELIDHEVERVEHSDELPTEFARRVARKILRMNYTKDFA